MLVDVTCSRCDTLLGIADAIVGTNRTAVQDAISDAGWPLYEAHASTCTEPLTGASWIGRVINRVDTSYTIVP